jgi:hypothetical protein
MIISVPMHLTAFNTIPLTLLICCSALAATPDPADPIVVMPGEQRLIRSLPDGGLPPSIGVQNIEVFRCSRDVPELTDGKGWTYNHHVDLGRWKNRLYLAWTNGQKDEDVWPAHEVYSTSTDGFTWTPPAELFPQGVSTSLRMYFFHAPNGRMLAIAGLRTGTEKLVEVEKTGVVVREILADHTLAKVFTLIPGKRPAMIPQPLFDTSPDAGFVDACRQLIANQNFLEQQDYGSLLGDARMSIYHYAPALFGRAFCFFHRKDGALVGLCKRGWVIVSTDDGKTWSQPAQPRSIITGMAKEWAQPTPDGRYALLYDPQTRDRFPLVVLTSDDGITFNNMCTVHGELPPQRYEGGSKNNGPQYVRGISEWAGDDTPLLGEHADDLWVVYSINKEDIWVSRIPVPIEATETTPIHDNFNAMQPAGLIQNWNTYSPLWAPVKIAEAPDHAKVLSLEDRDPYDYAKAERVFPESTHPTIRFKLQVQQLSPDGTLQIDVSPASGSSRPIRLILDSSRTLWADSGSAHSQIGVLPLNEWTDIALTADCQAGKFTVSIAGQSPTQFNFANPADSLQRLIFRTGPYRGVSQPNFVTPGTDKPTAPGIFLIRDMEIE